MLKEAHVATFMVVSALSLAVFAFGLTVCAWVRAVGNHLPARWKHLSHHL